MKNKASMVTHLEYQDKVIGKYSTIIESEIDINGKTFNVVADQHAGMLNALNFTEEEKDSEVEELELE
jgi:hypothetical protein